MSEDIELWGKHLLERLNDKEATENHKYFRLCLEEFAGRTTRKQDAMIAVTGDTGMGKSTLALGGSMVLNQPTFNVKFDWPNICYSITDLPNIIERATSEEANSYVIDEAMDVADASSYMTKINRELRKVSTKVRKKRNIYWWCIPDFLGLDPGIRNRLVKWWFHIFWQSDHEERNRRYAMAAFFRKDMNPFQSDKWGINDVARMKKGITDHVSLMRYFRRVRSFVSFVAFPILPSVIEDKYEINSFEALKETGREFKATFSKKKEEISV